MSALRIAAQQALEALLKSHTCPLLPDDCEEAITALRAALTQQADPVAKVELMMTGGNAGLATRIVEIDDHLRERLRPGQLLYTAPPQQAEPVGVVSSQVKGGVMWHRWPDWMPDGTKLYADLAPRAKPVEPTP